MAQWGVGLAHSRERPDSLVDLMPPPPPLHTGGDGRTGGGLWSL